MNKKICCIIGHGPENLPFGGKESVIDVYKIKIALYHAIEQAIEDKYTYFINGACRGVDFWAAEHILQLRKQNPLIKLEFVITCDSQTDSWCFSDLQTYNNLLKQANGITRLGYDYTPDCLQIKNKYMVNKSSLIIAVWNGQPSETKYCLDYAIEKGLKTNIIAV